MMNIREINDQFYKGLIEHYKSIGDTENAKKTEEFYGRLRSQRKDLDENNKRIICELTE
ncbi:hypothetical protein BN2127_JRS9_03383 [Bacillus subtilis]|uniref:hypothetical protein n=1 Tax=Bacillus subtilis TaxID=1423 RepID=UPI0006A93B13|nr:hypothetical protein [Bacillus subtilis]CUB20642.1 hypothetical protein BN2127_JRS2_03382 [Bacillus subtilis]CUB58334.1 hypothetical protein BN2127_JRS9_03383 [Bacillus subtilis]